MNRPCRRRLLCLLACLLASVAVHAQDPSDAPNGLVAAGPANPLLQEGIQAYREARYEDALRAFQAAADARPDDAEAHYLLARVYFDTPLRDESRAGREIGRARELDPENLAYMVAELQQLRTDTWNFFQELMRQRQRLELAEAILERDPDNGLAHEEFGTFYIRDYHYYRNAIAFPTLAFASADIGLDQDASDDDLGRLPEDELTDPDNPDDPGQIINRTDFLSIAGETDEFGAFGEAGALPVNDRFAVETLQEQGATATDLSARADRAYARAVFHLGRALESDPRRRSAYDEFMRLYGLAGAWGDALDMLSQMLVFFPEDEEMWRYLGLANHRLGNGDAAAVAFDQALERTAPETRAVFEDIALLLPEEEQDDYRADPAQTAQRFWTSENPRYLTPYNERKLEHYSRLTYADLMYRTEDLGLRGWETERGKIHVRYGVPRSDVIITGGFQQIVEAFGRRIEGFEPNAAEQVGMESNRFNVWDYGDFRFVFEDPFNNGEFRLYSPPADLFALTGPGAAAIDRMDYVRIARETFRETPERYDYEAPGRRIGLPYLVTTFKGEAGRTDLYVHYGIPIADDFDPDAADVVDLTVQTGAFLISADRDLLVERRRTRYGLNASQVETFADVQLWTDTQPMEAPPGPHTVSVEFETVGGGTSAVQRRDIVVPDYTGQVLALSSIMLAYGAEETDEERIPGVVVRDGLAIAPAPWSVFNHEQPIYLFFEVYSLGLAGGRSDYEVEAELRPKDTSTGLARLARSLFGGGDRGVSTRFPVQGDRADDAQYVILDAADQEPGFYTLTLRIRDRVSGREVEETTDLYLE